MAGNPVNSSIVNSMAANDAAYIGQFYAWVKKRLIQWQANAGTAAELTALGITATADQNAILALVADLDVLMQVIEGTQSAANTRSIVTDLAALTGLN